MQARSDVLALHRAARLPCSTLHASARAFTCSLRYETRRIVPRSPRQGPRRVRRRRSTRSWWRPIASRRSTTCWAPASPTRAACSTQLSAFWFGRTGHIVPNHLISTDVADYPDAARAYASQLEGRSMLARRTTPLPVECVARGYMSGSGWKDYKATGEVCGIALPAGLRESDRLPEPIFTPATKADSGHDENISEAAAAQVVGAELLARLKTLTLALYAHGVAHAESQGHHPRRHQVRVRPDRRRRAAADRRDDDAGLVALLAEGHVRARRAAAKLRQAVRARLSRVDQVEQAAAGARRCRRRRRRTRAASTSTPFAG